AVSSAGRGVYLACVVSGMATLVSMMRALSSGDLDSVSLEWPRIPFYDALNRKEIHNCDLTPQYLRMLREGAEVLPFEVEGHIRQSKVLLGHQFAFSRYLEEWIGVAAQGGLEIRKFLEDSDAQVTSSEEERICFVIAASDAIHRVKTKWHLKQQVDIASPALRELLALIGEGVLTREQFVELIAGPQVQYQPILDSMRRAMDGIAVSKEYPLLNETNRRVRPIQNAAD